MLSSLITKLAHVSLGKMHPRSLKLSLVLMFVTVAAGLVIRFAHLGLPPFVVKYGGSMLWASMIYWVSSTLLPRCRLLPIGLISGILATAVEFAKLYHQPALDAFRLTLPGILLLGRIFSVWDIVAYWLAIGVGLLIDALIRRKQRPWETRPTASTA